MYEDRLAQQLDEDHDPALSFGYLIDAFNPSKSTFDQVRTLTRFERRRCPETH